MSYHIEKDPITGKSEYVINGWEKGTSDSPETDGSGNTYIEMKTSGTLTLSSPAIGNMFLLF